MMNMLSPLKRLGYGMQNLCEVAGMKGRPRALGFTKLDLTLPLPQMIIAEH